MAFARERRRTADAGMSLLEVVVAMAIFAVGVTAILGIFVSAGDVAGDNIRRTAAANLVNQTLEIARAQTALEIPNGRTVSTQNVGGTIYTITQNAGFLTSNATTNVCLSANASLAYKLVRVSITWPDMGTVAPVTGDVLRSIGVGAIDSSTGVLAVLVSGSTGRPMSDVTLTLSGTSVTQTTGDDGCAVFAGLAASTYSARVSQAGYVGVANDQFAQSTTMTVSTGAIARTTLLYDTQRTLNFTLDSPVGSYVMPAGIPLRIGNSLLSETTVSTTCTGSATSVCLTGIPGSLQHLFPAIYTVKAGSCSPADPSQGVTDIRAVTANNSTTAIPMGAVTVNVKSFLGASAGGRTVTFTPSSAANCLAGDSYTTSSVSGGSTVLLPYGTWTLSTSGLSAPSSITLSPSGRTASVTLATLL